MGTVLKRSFGATLYAKGAKPSRAQKRYLDLGTGQPGGKLPLFDADGQRITPRTIKACLDAGWCEPWHRNPIEPKWLVCRITESGCRAIGHNI